MSKLQVREARVEDAAAMGLIMVAAHFDTFLGVIPEQYLDLTWSPEASAEGWRRWFKEDHESDEMLLVAELGRKVVGLVLAGQASGDVDYPVVVSALYVLPTSQRKGVGRALLRAAAERLIQKGMTAWLIGCVRENPNTGFYQVLGGIEHHRAPNTIDNYPTEEIFYGWPDLQSLLNPSD